jgi:hypothetical protein
VKLQPNVESVFARDSPVVLLKLMAFVCAEALKDGRHPMAMARA